MRSILKNKELLSNRTLIYSQWEGYLEGQKEFLEKNNINIQQMHISGHAYCQDIQKLIGAISPKNIVPIHTKYPERFKELTDRNVVLLNDNQSIEI